MAAREHRLVGAGSLRTSHRRSSFGSRFCAEVVGRAPCLFDILAEPNFLLAVKVPEFRVPHATCRTNVRTQDHLHRTRDRDRGDHTLTMTTASASVKASAKARPVSVALTALLLQRPDSTAALSDPDVPEPPNFPPIWSSVPVANYTRSVPTVPSVRTVGGW